jgi:hypothetical protein
MKKQMKYDTPILAMIKAFNDFAGGECCLTELRDQWYFHMETRADNRFVYWLDATMELINQDVKILYKRNAGWYTSVKFYIEREIQL